MFMTSPHFEVRVPRSLLSKGSSCLEAVSLSTGAAWFVLTTQHEEEKTKFYQTTLVSWASTLRSLLEGLGSASVVGLQWVRPTAEAGGWRLTDVSEVWLPDEQEEADTGSLLFGLPSAKDLLSEQGSPVKASAGCARRLLATVQSCS
jgi:hypothetical protein